VSRFVRNSLFGTLAGISTTLGNFLSSLVVSRVLGVDQAGSVAFAIWVVWLGTTVINVGVPFTLARYLPEVIARDGMAEGRRLAALLLRPFAAVASLPAVGFLIFAIWTLTKGRHGSTPLGDPVICILVGLHCTTLALGDFARSVLRGSHAFARVAKLTAASALLQLGGLVLGSMAFGARGAVAAYVVASLLPLVVLGGLPSPQGRLDPDLVRRLARYTRFRWGSDLLGFLVWSRIEILFLQLTWGVGAIGLFTVGMTLANLAVQGPLMLTWALLPQFSEQHGRQDRDSMRALYATGTRLLAFLIFPACFGLAAVLPTLLPLLYGPAFAGAIPAAQVLICGACVAAVAAVGSNLVWALERSDVDFYAGLVGAVLSVVGGLVLIAPFGEFGAAVSRIVTQAAAVGISSWFLAARLGFAIPLASLARLLASALLCGAAARAGLAIHDGVLGLALAIPGGALVYIVAIRASGALEPEDVARLRAALQALPMPIARHAGPLAELILG
jgi:O-antigen/teichoic acid export membrane protein